MVLGCLAMVTRGWAEEAGADEKLMNEAALCGEAWMKCVREDDWSAAMKLWAQPSGSEGAEGDRQKLASGIREEREKLGKFKQGYLLRNRSTVGGESGSKYVGLAWFCVYEKKARRESVVVTKKSAKGSFFITGLRVEELPQGSQRVFDMAANVGQMVVLRINLAPEGHWRPYIEEAKWLATAGKVALPAIPDAPKGGPAENEQLSAELMRLLTDKVMQALVDVPEQPRFAAEAVMRAYGLLAIYDPGNALCAQLTNLVAESASKAKVPRDMWHPLVRSVIDKAPRSRVAAHVALMTVEISDWLGKQEEEVLAAKRATELLKEAMTNMSTLTSYEVRAEITAGDKTARLEATLGVAAMDLKLTGFDGSIERREVGDEGPRVSLDDGKTWQKDEDKATTIGLCRTLTAPVDPAFKVAETNTFALVGEEVVEGETLLHIRSAGAGTAQAMDYWLLISKRGPVVRRARVPMQFGAVAASGLVIYRKLRGYADPAKAEESFKKIEQRVQEVEKKAKEDAEEKAKKKSEEKGPAAKE